MDERKQIAEDTLDQLIEQALRELDRVEPDGLAEERMSDISDEIRRDLWLEETQRTLMLDYITQLNRVAQKQRRCLYIQGAKDCVQLLRGLGVIKYPREMLRDLLLGLHSMCKGADARFFNGHTNISSSRFLVFCVKGLDNVAQNLRDALLFNILSYMSDQLLTAGNTVAAIDELYLWLSNPTAVTYIRNSLKRVRKKESALILASQNLEDFDQPGIRELTRPLFAIPTHQFLFNAGSVDKRFYMENLQLELSEFELIRYPQRGVCLYKCGNERYLLEVHAPPYKEKLFGTAGGR